MKTLIAVILHVYATTLPTWAVPMPTKVASDACGGIEVSKSADCAVMEGDTCQQACYDQDFNNACVSQCGLQNCHDYNCFEWHCVADCIDQHMTSCLNGCDNGGALFCDASLIVSGKDVDACVAALCSNDVSVDGAECP